jgi:PAS domain S-box-containing protein
MNTYDEQFFSTVLDSVTDPFAIYDREFKILKCNQALMDLFQLPEDQLIGRSCYEVFYQRMAICDDCHVQEVFHSGEPRMLEKRVPTPDGSERIFEVHSYPIKDHQGAVTRAVEHAREITVRKRAEEELGRYRLIVSAVHDQMSFIDRDYIYRTVNDAYTETFKRTREDIIGHSVAELFGTGTFEEQIKDHLDRCLSGEEVHYRDWLDFPDGKRRCMQVSYYPFFENKDCVSGVVVNARDITDLELAEEALRESEERFRHAFENASIGMCLVDTEGRLLKVNNQMSEILGYSQEELEAMTVNDITHPDYVDVSPRFIQQASSGEISHAEFEKQYYHKKGHVVWGQVTSSLVRDDSGAPLYFISHVKDITERKSLEDQLQTSRKFSDKIINSITDNLIVVDPRTHTIVQANDAFHFRVGLEPPAAVGMRCHEIMLDRNTPCAESGIGCPMEETIRSKRPALSDKIYPNAEGVDRLLEVATYPLLDAQGEISSIIRLERDVTEKREMEEALAFRSKELQKTQHQLETLFDISRQVSAKDSLPEIVRFVQEIGQEIFPESEMLCFLLDGEKQRFLDLEEYNSTVVGPLLSGLHELEQSGLVADFVQYLQSTKDTNLMSAEYSNDIPAFLKLISKSYPSWFGFPISTPHQCIGYFMLGSTISQEYSREDMHFVHNLFSQIAGDIHHLVRHETEMNLLRQEVVERSSHGEIIGKSDEMQKIYELIGLVSGSDATVLITGENGTGKELAAQAIHRESHRGSGPFIVANCSAYSPTLLESELFGHEKGAFTGAIKRKKGRIERAKGGTLFLDEIGDIAPATQVLLLRFLQDHCFERVGGEETLEADVRVLAATNQDLYREVEAGRFRDDLYYRLNVIAINMPPLRDRKEDIPMLCKHFLEKYSLKEGKQIQSFSSSAMQALMDHDWPGNVRQLENAISHAVILAQGSVVEGRHLPQFLKQVTEEPPSTSLEENERRLILAVLQECGWNKHEAARQLQISRSTLYSKIRRYNLMKTTTSV